MKIAPFQVQQTLEQAASLGVAPALALGVCRSLGPVKTWYAGRLQMDRRSAPCDEHTIFDLASLTKPLSTTLAILKRIEGGVLTLSAS